MSRGIENDILSNIEQASGPFEVEDDNTDFGTDDVGADGGDNQQDEDLTPQLKRRQTQQDNLADDEPVDPNTRRPAKATDGKSGKDQQRKGGLRTNERGDIVDEQGKVIASRGMERRLHGQLERVRAVSRDLEARNVELARQLAEANHLGSLPRELGLGNDEVRDGLEIVGMFKRDPARAAREVIERALAAGVQLHQIVNEEVLPNISLGAAQRLIDERLPKRNRDEGPDVTQVQEEARIKANQFLADYPEAEVHMEDVANLMKEIKQNYKDRGLEVDPYVAAERAFEQIVQFANKHGLDLNEPLRPQVLAMQESNRRVPDPKSGGKGTPANRQPGSSRVPNTQRPMPRGSSGGGEIVERRSRQANPDDSYDSIIRESMKEQGINL